MRLFCGTGQKTPVFLLYLHANAHFDAQPEFKVGDTIHMGQSARPTGNSGIGRNGAQSQRRRPHSLCPWFLLWKVCGYPWESDSAPIAMDGSNALFTKGPCAESKHCKRYQMIANVPVAIMLEDALVVPKGSKVVWPITGKIAFIAFKTDSGAIMRLTLYSCFSP